MDKAKVKIAIVTSSLGIGGAERWAGQLSIMLTDLGYDVHIISVLDHIEFEYRGTLLNLGLLKNADDSRLGRFRRLLTLRNYLKKHDFYRIIDTRTRTITWSEWIISRLVYKPTRTIYVVHSFTIDFYFPKNKLIAKRIYKDSPAIVAVSEEIKLAITMKYGYANVTRVCNPIRIYDVEPRPLSAEKYILSYGRIDDDVKNFSLLIDGYALSELPQNNIPLFIMGDGKDVDFLKNKVSNAGLAENVIFKPRHDDPFPFVKAANFTVLTSRFEGFPTVILESLALGIPVISVDCESGPKELIADGYNGLLVANNSPRALADAMNRFVANTDLYEFCKTNTTPSVAHLSTQNAMLQWQQILMK